MIERLELDLKYNMNMLGVGDFIILLAEEPSEVCKEHSFFSIKNLMIYLFINKSVNKNFL